MSDWDEHIANREECNGVQYPDGTFWHQTAYTSFGRFRIDTACKTRNGILLSPAPSGGCGGEW